jgi:hypothetical protein
MKKGKLVYHREFGRGLVVKKSPSGSIVQTRFKHCGLQITLSSDLTIVK